MLLLYKILNVVCSPLLGLVFAFRLVRGKEVFARAKERWGIASLTARPQGKLIWIHAASVGETASVLPLIHTLVEDKKFTGFILLTSTTVGSVQFLKTRILPERVVHQLCPIENIFAIKTFLRFWRLNLALFVESEFWPCIITETAKACKVFSINTSISDASLKRWRLAMPLLRQMFKQVFKFVPQSLHDVHVLANIGMRNIEYVGHLKYTEQPLDRADTSLKAQLKQLKKDTAGRKVLLFVSTHEGEEAMAADVYIALRKKHKSMLCILIPRRVNRAQSICKLLCDKGIKVTTRSTRKTIPRTAEFYLVDTMGEVSLFAALSPIAVMGGSFVPIGGHNIIEPARRGAVVIAGPYMYDSKNLCEEFEQHEAALFVRNQDECIKAIRMLWDDESELARYKLNAKLLLKSKRHILPKLKQLILKHL
jgi:3-deoxy-D-manno-octulosonic-acid transferase